MTFIKCFDWLKRHRSVKTARLERREYKNERTAKKEKSQESKNSQEKKY